MSRTASHIADAVDPQRLQEDLAQLARIGARADGGVCRLALGEADLEARRWLIARGRELGCRVTVDGAANVFLHRTGGDPALAPLLLGSHLDSQPAGGRYDGSLGVVSALAALEALNRAGYESRRPMVVVSWTNEEGARFTPGTAGSSVFAGKRTLASLRDAVDADGVAFGEALDATLAALTEDGLPVTKPPARPYAFLELHIEQGPVLEAAGAPVGVVTGIQGVAWYRFTVSGVAGHAGTTPRAARHDALEGACELARELREVARDDADTIRFTIGTWRVEPGSVNTIPDRVTFTVDLRHPDGRLLEALDEQFRQLGERRWAGCEVRLQQLSAAEPVAFEPALVSTLDEAARLGGLDAPQLVSGAFHDALHLAGVWPTAMLFVACAGGISHHPAESVTPEDATAGARTLAAATALLLEREAP